MVKYINDETRHNDDLCYKLHCWIGLGGFILFIVALFLRYLEAKRQERAFGSIPDEYQSTLRYLKAQGKARLS